MSMFMLPTSAARPYDGSTNYKMMEICSDSSNLSGTVRHRFSSSANQWFVPKESYMVVTVGVTKTGGTATAPTEVAVVLGDNLNFCKSPAAAII